MQARDLKSIIESENHELKTQFCNVPFTITPDRNIYNIIRNKYKELALEAQTKFAEINEQFEDLDDLINNAPSAFVYCIEKALLELIQDIISVDIYTIDKDAVVNMAFDGVYFDEFTEAFEVIDKKYEKILTDLNDAEYARELRKESRPRWQSATFGGNAINAWSNQLDATAMNITEGIAYSLVNAVGNMMSRSYARSQIKELFNTMSLRQDMVNSVYDSCFNLHLLLLDIVEKNTAIKFAGTVSAADTQKAQAMFNNMMSISLPPEKRDAFIVQIFELDPYEDSFYSKLIDTMGDEDDSIGKFSEFFGVNIFDIKNDILARFVNDNIGETEEDALFMVQALLRTKGYVCVPCALYAYYIRPDSAIHQSDFSPKQYSEITTWEKICALVERQPGSMSRTAEERFVVACAHVYYRMAGSDHADPELQAKIVRMAREHWRAALRVPNSKKRDRKSVV